MLYEVLLFLVMTISWQFFMIVDYEYVEIITWCQICKDELIDVNCDVWMYFLIMKYVKICGEYVE